MLDTSTYRSVSPTARANAILPPWRILKAYRAALVVMVSYLWLKLRVGRRSPELFRGMVERAHRKNARRIYRAIVDLQGLYIKVGQLFSSMTNFLPAAFREELEALQDRVPPRAYEAIERRFRDEFGDRTPDDIFTSFDRQPIASASIGQVHVATLRDGRRVAVKVQHPDIERVVRADLTALRRIFALLHRMIPHHGLDVVYSEIRTMVLQELDFRAEADNAIRIAKNFSSRSDVKLPEVISELSSQHVLTTEFVDGVKINDEIGLQKLGIDRRALARQVIETYCQQIFVHGIYHADPHPGNLLISAGPTLHFLDFGAVAELSQRNREALISIIQGAIRRDTSRIVSALREMGFLAHSADPRVYDRVVEYFHTRLHAQFSVDSFNLKDLKFDPRGLIENLSDLRRLDISMGDLTDTFRVPKEWIMLERTLLLLVGVCTELDPDLNPLEIIQPHVEAFVLGDDGDWSKLVLDTSREVVLSLISLPADIRKFTTRALQGELEVKLANQLQTNRLYYALGHQLIYTALAITSGVVALHFHEMGADLPLRISLASACTFLVLLGRSMWNARRWVRRRGRA